MTPEQELSIRNHLVKSLYTHGFGDVVDEINSRLEEAIDEDSNLNDQTSLLLFFIKESIDILESLSNDNYYEILNRFNEYTHTDNTPIRGIQVELISLENPERHLIYDLRDLPSYLEIIEVFRQIQNEIENEN